MRKVIKGRMYDTETAQLMGSWDAPCSVTDFDWYEESLYKKRTGEFFIHGSGNARSPYARESYGSATGGEGIRLLSYAEAQEWAESHLDADGYEAIFGEVPEDAEQAALTVFVSAAAKAKLEREAARRGVSQRRVVEDMIDGL